jgi:hypothetical protein
MSSLLRTINDKLSSLLKKKQGKNLKSNKKIVGSSNITKKWNNNKTRLKKKKQNKKHMIRKKLMGGTCSN